MPSLLSTPGPLLASATTTSVVPATLPSMMGGERSAEQQRPAVARSEPKCDRAGSSLDLRCVIDAPHLAHRSRAVPLMPTSHCPPPHRPGPQHDLIPCRNSEF